MTALAKELVQALRDQRPTGPYMLVGFCAHAVLAYEMAQQLVVAGHKVSFLALFDPSWVWWDQRPSLNQRFQSAITKVRSIPWRERPQRFLEKSRAIWRQRKRQAPPGNVVIEPAWESLYRLLRPYNPKPYQGQVSIIINENADGIAQQWEQLGNDVQVAKIPTSHDKMFEDPAVSLVSDQIRNWLGDDLRK